MSSEPKYWFRAKRYGWGWGLPCAWQGWVVFAIFFGLLGVGAFVLRPVTELIAYAVVLSGLLIGVCWVKGEPPHWRWGDEKRD